MGLALEKEPTANVEPRMPIRYEIAPPNRDAIVGPNALSAGVLWQA